MGCWSGGSRKKIAAGCGGVSQGLVPVVWGGVPTGGGPREVPRGGSLGGGSGGVLGGGFPGQGLFWAFSKFVDFFRTSSQPFLGLGASSGPRLPAFSGPRLFWAFSELLPNLFWASGPFLGFWTWTSSQPFLGPSKPFLGAFSGLGPLLGF